MISKIPLMSASGLPYSLIKLRPFRYRALQRSLPVAPRAQTKKDLRLSFTVRWARLGCIVLETVKLCKGQLNRHTRYRPARSPNIFRAQRAPDEQTSRLPTARGSEVRSQPWYLAGRRNFLFRVVVTKCVETLCPRLRFEMETLSAPQGGAHLDTGGSQDTHGTHGTHGRTRAHGSHGRTSQPSTQTQRHTRTTTRRPKPRPTQGLNRRKNSRRPGVDRSPRPTQKRPHPANPTLPPPAPRAPPRACSKAVGEMKARAADA